jgi:hypothetical protein
MKLIGIVLGFNLGGGGEDESDIKMQADTQSTTEKPSTNGQNGTSSVIQRQRIKLI